MVDAGHPGGRVNTQQVRHSPGVVQVTCCQQDGTPFCSKRKAAKGLLALLPCQLMLNQ
jgi:hypothetical protein